MASDAEIAKETIRRFYSILEETLVALRLPPFRPRKASRHVSQRERFIIFDVGVRNAILGIHRHPLSPTEVGGVFEQWFILQCLYLIHADKKPYTLSSYRTDAGAEVDLVIDTGDKLLAIECKYSQRVTESALSGLRSFAAIADKPTEKYVVYLGQTRQKFSQGELAVPYQEFLLEYL